jgi:NAD(P)-dependent dehydrogenase (short-subunit alcohol dehydrogenase family)
VAAALGKGTHSVHADVTDKFNMLRLAATSMAGNEPLDGDRGVCVLTASIAAFDGQLGRIPYAAAKAGIVGMTLVAARDLASKQIRVCTIAPGTFATPLLSRLAQQSKTRCSTAKRSGSTARCGCRRDDRHRLGSAARGRSGQGRR